MIAAKFAAVLYKSYTTIPGMWKGAHGGFWPRAPVRGSAVIWPLSDEHRTFGSRGPDWRS